MLPQALANGWKSEEVDVLCCQQEGAVVEDVVHGVDGDDQWDHGEAEGEAEGEEGDHVLARPSFIELHFENLMNWLRDRGGSQRT
jgi:hypothetical protein